MKLASRIVMTLAMGATAATALAGAVRADESFMSTKLEYMEIDQAGGGTADQTVLTYGVEGRYDSGFAYDIELSGGERDGVGIKQGTFDLNYRVNGLVGPMAIFEAREIGGANTDQTLLGVEGGGNVAGVDMFGQALMDVDNDENFRVAMGASYSVSEDFMVSGEYTRFENDVAADRDALELEARYRMMGNMYGDFGVDYSTANDLDSFGVSAGIGLAF